jgi:hypothetical protein
MVCTTSVDVACIAANGGDHSVTFPLTPLTASGDTRRRARHHHAVDHTTTAAPVG